MAKVSKNGAWNEWISYILKGVEQTSIATIKRIKEIDLAMKEATQILQSKAKKVYSKDLIELLFSYPYTKIDFLEKKLKIHRHTASTYLKTCESVSLLQSIKIGRNKYFVNIKLFDILRKELL